MRSIRAKLLFLGLLIIGCCLGECYMRPGYCTRVAGTGVDKSLADSKHCNSHRDSRAPFKDRPACLPTRRTCYFAAWLHNNVCTLTAAPMQYLTIRAPAACCALAPDLNFSGPVSAVSSAEVSLRIAPGTTGISTEGNRRVIGRCCQQTCWPCLF